MKYLTADQYFDRRDRHHWPTPVPQHHHQCRRCGVRLDTALATNLPCGDWRKNPELLSERQS